MSKISKKKAFWKSEMNQAQQRGDWVYYEVAKAEYEKLRKRGSLRV